MILSDSKIRELKSDSKSEQIVKELISQQKKQDENIKKALQSINKSLESVKKISLQLSNVSKDGIRNEDKLIEIQKTTEESLQNSITALQTIKDSPELDISMLVDAVNSLGDKIEQKEIKVSVNQNTKSKEWKFSIIRDQFERIDFIKAIST